MNARSPCLRYLAWLGVTEPAAYGINLKYRFPMLCAMIGSGLVIAGGLNGVMANGIGVGGLPEFSRFSRATGVCAGNGYRHHHPDCTHLVYLSAKYRGHAGHCLMQFSSRNCALAFAGIT